MILHNFSYYFTHRTTKRNVYPNISFIQRKPKPLGTEFKNFVCAVLRANCHMEIQEGKDRMKAKKYCSSVGTTASCVRRLLDAAVSFETKKREHEQRKNENLSSLHLLVINFSIGKMNSDFHFDSPDKS